MSQPDLKLTMEAMECLRDRLEFELKELNASNSVAFTTRGSGKAAFSIPSWSE